MKEHNVTLVDEDTFQREVLASPLPVLVDFGAEWCPPCRALEPVLDGIAAAQLGRVRVVRIDADASATIAAKYRVRNLPTVIAFVAGEERARHTGMTRAEVLLGLVASP